MMEWSSLLPAVLSLLGAICGGIGTYIAIRVDLAVQKTRVDYIERAAEAAHELAGDAHDRINKLRKLYDETTQ